MDLGLPDLDLLMGKIFSLSATSVCIIERGQDASFMIEEKTGSRGAAIINFNQAPSMAKLIISAHLSDLRWWYNINLHKLPIHLAH